MNAILETTAQETARASRPEGRPQALDERKRAHVLYLLGLGLSRRMAARQAGCAHTTIARSAARDPLFALDLANAESEVDIEAMRRVREAAQEQKNWRAAAWLLERRNPDEFGRRTAHSISGDRVMELLAEVFSYTFPRLPEEEADGFLRMFNARLREVEEELQEADRWRRLAAEDRGVRGRGRMEDLRSPYEHPDWREPPPVDPLSEDRPEDHPAYDPLLTVEQVARPEPEAAPDVGQVSNLPGRLEICPTGSEEVLHQHGLSCRDGTERNGMPKLLSVNYLRQQNGFAPPRKNGEAVQNSNGTPPRQDDHEPSDVHPERKKPHPEPGVKRQLSCQNGSRASTNAPLDMVFRTPGSETVLSNSETVLSRPEPS